MTETRVRTRRARRPHREHVSACAHAGVTAYCPRCGGDIELHPRSRSGEAEADLRCGGCGLFFPHVVLTAEALRLLRLRRLAAAVLSA